MSNPTINSTAMIMAEAWPTVAGRAIEPLSATTGVGQGEDDTNTPPYSPRDAAFDIRGFFPLELEHVCSAFSMAQSQVLLLTAELTRANRELDVERRMRQEREEREERETGERENLEGRRMSETDHASLLQSSLDTLREENEALRRGNERDQVGRLAGTALLEAELGRLQANVTRLHEENASQLGVIEKMNVSLRLAGNKSRRLEFQLQEQEDNDLDLRLFLQSSLYTMNKKARAKKQEGTPQTTVTERNVKVKRLLERVKASDTGIDVTNLSVSEVQGFLSLLVRRMDASSIATC